MGMELEEEEKQNLRLEKELAEDEIIEIEKEMIQEKIDEEKEAKADLRRKYGDD